MDKELNEILDKQNQLRAMERSLYEFADGLKKKQDEFLVKHLGFDKDQKNISIFDIIKKSSEKKSSLIL